MEKINVGRVQVGNEEQKVGLVNVPVLIGKDGKDGVDGNDGVGIKKIEQTVESFESGGINQIEIELSNGTSTVFEVRNGKGGENGVAIQEEEPTEEYTVIWVDENDNTGTIIDEEKIVNEIKAEIQPVLNQVVETSERAETIAKGRATGYVFDTLEDLDTWLQNTENISKLVLGDNLYIRATGVPDYWWDGTSKQVLETQKVDLTEYVKNTEYEEWTFTLEDGSTVTKKVVVL